MKPEIATTEIYVIPVFIATTKFACTLPSPILNHNKTVISPLSTSDDCASEPCQNGAACVDGVTSYSCQCLPGFSGTNCQDPSYFCSSGLTGARCENAFSCENDYRTGLSMCVCSPGYTQGG